MKSRVNSYLAILFITIAGAGAALLIVHIGSSDVYAISGGSEASYASLKESILKP